MPPRNVSIILLTALISLVCYAKVERNRYATIVTEAMRLISAYYIEDVDRQRLFEGAMQGMARELDPYSAYIPPAPYAQLEAELDQEFGGVGITVEVNPETERLTVVHPLFDTPAQRAGLRAGDEILEINNKSTVGMTLEEAVKLMRGKPGTTVELLLLRRSEEEPFTVLLERAIIPIRSVLGDTPQPDGTWDYRLTEHPRIGYVRLTTFGVRTAEELEEVLELRRSGKQPFEALILDVRNNAGGLLDAANGVCDLFLPSGTIVSTRGRGGEELRTFEATAGVALDPDVPIVVLVNRYSASAAEIVAACLQDHGRAAVAGERTWGKGTVQNVIQLESGKGALKITTATYWRPSGQNIHRHTEDTEQDAWGVRPSPGLQVRLTDEQFQQVFRARHARDLRLEADPAPRTEAELSSEEESTEQTNDTPLVDPQLQKAVEFLESQLDGRSSPEGIARVRAS